jgi:SAM-dependent methyltransferase
VKEDLVSEYDLFAELYDLEHAELDADIELYRNFAVRCDGPVLELGCGSGRVGIALARDGLDVVGVDNSAAMLALAHTHAARVPLRDRIRFEQLDVRSMSIARQFALAIYPLNGFLHLLSREDQQRTLWNIGRALVPGGLLIVDLPNPHVVFVPDMDDQLVVRRRFRSPEGHWITSMTCTRTHLADQTQHLTLFYDRVDGQGMVRRTTVEMDLRFVYRYEMACLLEQAGFTVDDVYGSYDMDPYDSDSESMILVAYRRAVPGE